jgi:GTPase
MRLSERTQATERKGELGETDAGKTNKLGCLVIWCVDRGKAGQRRVTTSSRSLKFIRSGNGLP